MERWIHGDLVAFEKLYRQYEKLVFKNAYLITGSKDDAEDIVQDVFLAVWRYRQTFDPIKSKFTTWLQRITINECTRKRKQATDFTLIDEIDFPETTSRQPEEILVTKSEYEALLKTLSEMGEKHRTAVVLRYLSDLSYAEIAEVLNVPIGTVKSRLNHALACLKERLALGKELTSELEEEHGL